MQRGGRGEVYNNLVKSLIMIVIRKLSKLITQSLKQSDQYHSAYSFLFGGCDFFEFESKSLKHSFTSLRLKIFRSVFKEIRVVLNLSVRASFYNEKLI